MASVEKSVLVAHSASQMFSLVDRCEDYPLFLPWCSRVELLERDEEQTSATLFIGYRGVKSHFSTSNKKRFPVLMQIRLVDGPFRSLEGEWRFKPLGENACKIEFNLHFEFSSGVLARALNPVFHYIANSFVDAFVQRAGQQYGSSVTTNV